MESRHFAERREKLRRIMDREGLDGLLITHPANRYYLSGFELHDSQCNESSGCLIITQSGDDWLCTDSRYEEAAGALWEKERVYIYRDSSALEVGALLRSLNLDKIGFESKVLSWNYVWHLQNGLVLEAADGLVEELRMIKDSSELELLEQAAKLNHDMMAWLPSCLTVGATEGDIAWNLEKFFREHGATALGFPAIVGVNKNSALPHYSPANNPAVIEPNSIVLVDAGASLKNYCSDQTRTFWVGDKPDERFLQTLDLVKGAQQAAIEVIRPGALGKDVFAAAHGYFAKHGVEAHFIHSLGHGIGLEVHEEPRLALRSNTVLQPGMVVTVEPGLYYPEWGGVRWEYMVAVTEDGCRIL